MQTDCLIIHWITLQVEILEIDINASPGLAFRHVAPTFASAKAAPQLCKGDVFTSVFLVCSKEAHQLDSAASLIIKWCRKK